MIDYDVETKVPDTEWFSQHNIAGLCIWQYIHRSVQSGEAFTVDGNKHIHTHASSMYCWAKLSHKIGFKLDNKYLNYVFY